MATPISGTGTSTNPWIVYSYDQLKDTFERLKDDETAETYSPTFIKLGCDIDCNAYGEGWEWKTIKANDNSARFGSVFDLNEHTIKNATIELNSTMFTADKRTFNIKNGNILNIFTIGNNTFISGCTLTNISLSLYADVKSYIFYTTVIDMCSIYLKSTLFNGERILVGGQTANQYDIKNSDIYIDFDNANRNNKKYAFFYNGTTTTSITMYGCRIRGHLGGDSSIDKLFSNKRVLDCVFDIKIDNFGDDAGTLALVHAVNTDEDTGIINTSIINNGDETRYGLPTKFIKCNSTQIKNTTWMNNNGFFCIELNENADSGTE